MSRTTAVCGRSSQLTWTTSCGARQQSAATSHNSAEHTAFSAAADAAAAAIESQEQLRDDTGVDFAVRMGLHTGEAIQRDRSYFGSDVNRAARLMSLAHGGQVLVSGATEVLLRDRVVLRPLGEHRLRGLRGRISVYQIEAVGLATEF